MRTSRGAVAALGMAFGVALAASTAFACTPSAQIRAVPGSGPGGSQIVIDGGAWDNTGPIDIHWNSVDGTPLASVPVSLTGGDGDFSVPVRIPDVAPDVYTIVATQPRLGGGVTKAAAAFQVTTTGAGGGAGGTPTNSGQATTRASGGSGSSDPAASSPATSSSSVGTAGGDGIPAPSSAAASSPAVNAPATSTATAGAPATSAIAPVTAAAGDREPTNAAAHATRAAAVQAGALPGTAAAESADKAPAAAPLDPTAMVSDDLWSGLVTPSGPGRGPSLVNAPVTGHGSPVTAGVALFSLAMVALAAGFGLAEVRRRRVSVTAAG